MYKDAQERLKDVQHLNEMDGPAFKIKNDPRITLLGKIFRKTSIDELPQLFDVFVGPRPALVKEVSQYKSWQK